MPKFRELGAESSPLSDSRLPPDPPGLIANRYVVQQSLGRGSFGTVFLINDTKAAPGEKLRRMSEFGIRPHLSGRRYRDLPIL
ncbi:serine/threonine-protein kinase Nek11 [Astyanax mexicanus]|nr:serine/threonine-protein kinase Nek11 [Astyanax mexicanus]